MNLYDSLELLKELCNNDTPINLKSLISTTKEMFSEYCEVDVEFYSWYWQKENDYEPDADYIVLVDVNLVCDARLNIAIINTEAKEGQDITNNDNVIITRMRYCDGKGNNYYLAINSNRNERHYVAEYSDFTELVDKIITKVKYGL